MQEPETSPPQSTCPFCGSSRLAAAGDKVDPTTAYRRCESCGEMWNLARLRGSANRQNYRPSWK